MLRLRIRVPSAPSEEDISMKELTTSEIHNLEWLKSVLEERSEYTSRFKSYAYRDMKRLETISRQNNNKWFLIESAIIILDIIWICIGIDLIIYHELNLIVFLLLTVFLLYQTFKLIFTENKTEQRKTINSNKTIK